MNLQVICLDMRTTIRLDEALLNQAKNEAKSRDQTLTSLIEQGLRLVLAQGQSIPRRQRIILPICRAGGGLIPGLDINDSASLHDIAGTGPGGSIQASNPPNQTGG